MLTVRPLRAPDRESLEGLLARGGPPDAFLRDTLVAHGIGDFFGAFEGDELVGASYLRRGAICAASQTLRRAARPLASAMSAKSAWGSVVGPEAPCGDIVAALRGGGERFRVDRVQKFMYVPRGATLGPGEPRLRSARPEDLDALVPIVQRYRVEDGLARRSDPATSWVRDHTEERIRAGHVWVVVENGAIVFTGAFNFLGPFGAGLGGIYTVPEARGQGLASRGTAEMCRIALAEGPVATLHVDPGNTAALRAYARAGLRPEGGFRLTFR